MSELTFRIGAFNADTRAVSVTFTSGEIVHKRDVNAVLKADGTYDKAATKARVEEVALGVAHKIAAGVITAVPADPAPSDD
ncbi:hypothetical protein [Novosphingobium sp. KN65.2]|uniref:hypothetical protein n=1 Tax=Novosphingobium sp. KN65.2 TaxID=1478134 RepID=UPI0005E3E966|nr:hypothetical protein [Novosphingobium sp. KN65.2]CDO37278.1 hypothetical protein SPHV1_310051 [Novosphingobium sp. KN65.2]